MSTVELKPISLDYYKILGVNKEASEDEIKRVTNPLKCNPNFQI